MYVDLGKIGFCDKDYTVECFLYSGFGSCCFPSIAAICVLLVCQFYTFNDDNVIKMMNYKDNKILTIKCKIGHKLNQKIIKTLDKWYNSLSLRKRKGLFFFIFVYIYLYSPIP